MRNRQILPLFLIVLVAGTASAQNIRKSMTVQDLVGEWELVFQEASFASSRTPGRGKGGKEIARITAKGDEVTIFKRFEDESGFTERTYIYFADGRGEINRWTTADGTAMEKATRSTWKNGILTSKGKYKSTLGSTGIECRCRLSNDFLKLECEEVQLPEGRQPPPFARGLVTKTTYRRL